MKVNGQEIPSFSNVITFIEQNFRTPQERFTACEYAWDMYLILSMLVSPVWSKSLHAALLREGTIAMGAMWGIELGCGQKLERCL